MGERKVQNFYYPVDFDPSQLAKRTKVDRAPVNGMLPFSLQCNTCGAFSSRGKKFNGRKEDSQERYLGIKIWRILLKCPNCKAEIAFKTDPQNSNYTLERGATRNFEASRVRAQTLAAMKAQRSAAEDSDAMHRLESRAAESRREMEQIDELEQLQERNTALAHRDPTQFLDGGKRYAEDEDEDEDEERRKREMAEMEAADEAEAERFFGGTSGSVGLAAGDDDGWGLWNKKLNAEALDTALEDAVAASLARKDKSNSNKAKSKSKASAEPGITITYSDDDDEGFGADFSDDDNDSSALGNQHQLPAPTPAPASTASSAKTADTVSQVTGNMTETATATGPTAVTAVDAAPAPVSAPVTVSTASRPAWAGVAGSLSQNDLSAAGSSAPGASLSASSSASGSGSGGAVRRVAVAAVVRRTKPDSSASATAPVPTAAAATAAANNTNASAAAVPAAVPAAAAPAGMSSMFAAYGSDSDSE